MKRISAFLMGILLTLSSINPVYAETQERNGTDNIVVTANVESSYSIQLPTELCLSQKEGTTYTGSYQVKAKGNLKDGHFVEIKPESSFEMVGTINPENTSTATVTQDATRFGRAENTPTGAVAIGQTDYASTKGTIEVELENADQYAGTLVFSYKLKDGSGFYDAEGNLLADWDDLVEDYGLDVEYDYRWSGGGTGDCNVYIEGSDHNSPTALVMNIPELSDCTKIKISKEAQKIGAYCFADAPIAQIEIPNSITTIGQRAFEGSSITEIVIPDSVVTFGSYIFYNATSLVKAEVHKTADSMFTSCSSLQEVYVKGGEEVSNSTFYHCTNLSSLYLADTIRTIGKNAFYACRSLHELELPKNLESIGPGAFNSCDIKSLTLPDSLRKIGVQSFIYTGLTSLTVPDTVEEIGEGAFYYMPHVYYNGSAEDTAGNNWGAKALN